MTEPVAGLAGVAATSERAVLHRSERGARLVGALDFALKAMRPATPPAAFAAEVEAVARAQEARAEAPAPAPVAAVPSPPPVAPPTPPAVIRAQIPPTPVAPDPLPSAPAAEPPEGPLDIMRWSRGVAPADEMAELAATLDAGRPKAVAPDVAALARAQENHMPRDVLEVLRDRHLGALRSAGGGDGR